MSLGKTIDKLMGAQGVSGMAGGSILQNPVLAQAQSGLVAGPFQNHGGPTLDEQLASRMRWRYLSQAKAHTLVVRQTTEKTYIWVITTEGKSVMLEDGNDLFPSDALVTQLRMLDL